MDDKVVYSKCSGSVIDIAVVMYEAYTANSDGLNYQGLPCPEWNDLTEAVRNHWCAAAIAACEEFNATR